MMRHDTRPATISGIDLDADVPCGHSQHPTKHLPDESAKYVVQSLAVCPCEPAMSYPICEFGWEWLGTGLVVCSTCYGAWRRDDALRIVQVLR